MTLDGSGHGWRLVLVLLFAATFSGCTDSASVPIRIGTNLWIGYEPLYLAREMGDMPGDMVRLVELPTTTDVIHALRAGTLEGAALTLDELLRLREDGIDLRAVLVLDFSHGADVVMAASGIQTLADIKGTTMGYEHSAVGAVMLHAALSAANLSADDVRLIPLPPDEHVPAIQQGRVDALVTYEPMSARLAEAGATMLFDSSQIPGRIIDVLAVRAPVLEEAPDSLRALVEGWYRGLEFLESSPDAALRISAGRQHIPPDELAHGYRGIKFAGREINREQLQGSQPRLLQTAAELGRLMEESGLLSRSVKVDDLLASGDAFR